MLTEALVAEAQARLLARIDATAGEVGTGFPHAADGRTGRWEVKPAGSWTGGFWVGLCWKRRSRPARLAVGCSKLYK